MQPDPAQLALDLTSPLMLLQRALFIVPLLCLTAFFAGTETALFSLSPGQREALAQKAAEGDSVSARILWLLSDPRRLITTLILGNEVVNISISALVTALVAQLVRHVPERVSPLLARADHTVVAVLSTALALPIIILFGELIPKTIGIKLALSWSRLAAAPMWVMTGLLWLPRVLITVVSGAVTLLFGVSAKAHAPTGGLREAEFRTLVDMGNAEGEIGRAERRMIHNVFDFGDLTVGRIMTPAARVFSLSAETPLSRAVDQVSRQRFSRVPIYRGRRDNIVGILFAKDLVGPRQRTLSGRVPQELIHPPLFVPRRAKCERLLREFQRRRTHMALVVDEYGKLVGLITMEDLLQSLFGDISEPVAGGKEEAAT